MSGRARAPKHIYTHSPTDKNTKTSPNEETKDKRPKKLRENNNNNKKTA